MPFTTAVNNKFVDAFDGKTTFTAPANLYAALSTSTPVIAGTGFTEPSGNAYARVAVPGSAWNAAASGSAANSAAINFPTPTGAWGTVTYVGLYDAATGGVLQAFYALPSSFAITTGMTVSIASGAATITNV